MSTQTLEKAVRTASTSTAARAKKTRAKPMKEQKDSKKRKETGRSSVAVWAGFFRVIVLLADCLLAFITAMVIIPLLGAWLHHQSGVSRGALSADGTIAMWLMPLFFLVALLAAGEIVVMRGMWRWATRMIAKIRGARGEAAGGDVTSKSTTGAPNQSKTNRKRST
ncbi:hypothetical protein [Streptomyces mobaraensis]|uniref:Uncharacterized protein n=1 Tax=Streptomyces mobaraensis TaxID=35621 RepID=A0A5N5W495_STRMB|nr:hypothetical protein [Streptomyces mobaraensis]KAB7839527.1 hypothetical protein FRZ00_21575 [Streptomyces mobaraensis]